MHLIIYKVWNKLNNLGLLHFIPDKIYIRISYFIKFNRFLNLDNPGLFTEKMQWLKINSHNPEYTVMADKRAVKEYVAAKIGNRYITPTIKTYKSADEINADELPEQFVLKCTHDSGGLVICRDKNKLEWPGIRRKLNRCLRHSYYKTYREWQYKDVVPMIIAEEYMENDPAEGLHDYKVWCFNGRAKYVQYITGRIGGQTYEGFYDENWQLQPFSYHNPLLTVDVPKPAKLPELFELADKLAAGIPFVRVDFYILPDDSIRFGEITFFPMTGMEHFHPESVDAQFGEMIDLPLNTAD